LVLSFVLSIREGFMPHYTDQVKKVFELANAAAKELKHCETHVIHLVLGLVREDSGVAAQVLKNRGFSQEKITAAMQGYSFGVSESPLQELAWTYRALHVQKEAGDEARALNHDYIGTEHILLAATGESPHQWLELANSDDLGGMRREILGFLGHAVEERKQEPGKPEKGLNYEEIRAKVFAIRDMVQKLATALQGI
jgi:ATP-dependent Clp protease ATP-binding subunit ClpC